ncbi:MAG TPA: hypothetical protein PKH24_13595 [Sedimentisphaerales bacterium]|jgi:ABC-type transport system involved in multi-copper enzyme maturation permease subunit|nr:hypothetical protein [Sedimentisphaerales bacterium]HNU29881.1 hypothetical protein [Sedimentisphaerales bacterium]
MQTTSILDLFQCFCRRRLSGPLFDKELRIASRRRRGYALRFAYVLLLMAFIALVWIPTVQLRTGAAMSRAHMEAAAKTITLGIVWFQFVGVQLVAAIMLSTTVSEEMYGRTLCVLMTTPLTDTDILVSKFVGVLRRCGPIWLLLFAYVVAFAWAKCFHPMAVVHAGVMIVSALLFLSATGFYFGSRCRRTTDAVTPNLALAGGLWCVLSIVAEAASFGMGAHRETGVSLIFALVPFGQAFAMVATTLDSYVTTVQCFGDARDAAGMATFMLLAMAGYLLVSIVFAWRAVRAFRRRVF